MPMNNIPNMRFARSDAGRTAASSAPGQSAHEAMATRPCLTCARERPLADYKPTSIWPTALGGQNAPALFHDVGMCKGCHALAEVQIDGAFLKSWFMQAELARAAQAFLDPAEPCPAPLTYLGTAQDFPVAEGQICDRWCGLTGESIYHLHPRSDDLWSGYGRNEEVSPLATDPGQAILVLSSPSQYWSTTALLSFTAHFAYARRFCINPFAGLQGLESAITEGPPAHASLFQPGTNSHQRVLNAGLHDDFSQRFLIRLALTTGKALFGDGFVQRPFTRLLRRAFWNQQPQAHSIALVEKPFALQGAWTLTLKIAQDILGLVIVSPTGKRLDCQIADDPQLWTDPRHENLRQGVVFIIIPQRQIFTQGLPLADCLAHRGGNRVHPEIARLEALRVTPRQLPSKQGFA